MSVTLDIPQHYSIPRYDGGTESPWRWFRLIDGVWIANASHPSPDTPCECERHRIWFDVRCLVCSGIVLVAFQDRGRDRMGGLKIGKARGNGRQGARMTSDNASGQKSTCETWGDESA